MRLTNIVKILSPYHWHCPMPFLKPFIIPVCNMISLFFRTSLLNHRDILILWLFPHLISHYSPKHPHGYKSLLNVE